MRPLLKILKWIFLVGLAVIVIAFLGLYAWRTVNQRANAKALALATPRAIDEAGYVDIGGIKQWVQIRGQDRENPVLLCVHGGPGGTWLPVTRLFASWEKDFTVVLWDQRGAGKTLSSTGPAIASTMTIDRMAQDGLEVAEHLRTRLGKKKIFLLAHSFGSILGVRMVKQRPELFAAYIGTGQASDLPRGTAMEYARLVDAATSAHDARTLEQLTQIGPPPFQGMQEVATFFQCAEKYQPTGDTAAMMELKRSFLSPPPNYSIGDELSRMRGFAVVPPWSLYEAVMTTDLTKLGPDFQVPVFMFQGTNDRVTPLVLAQEYFNRIDAPKKEFVALEKGGHFAVWSQAEAFGQELVRRVRPLASGQ